MQTAQGCIWKLQGRYLRTASAMRQRRGSLGRARQSEAVPQADGRKNVNGDEYHLAQNDAIPAATV